MQDKFNRYKVAMPLVATVCLIIGLWGGRALEGSDKLAIARGKLDEVFRIISRSYVDEVDMDSLVEMSVSEIIQNLDPHSNYLSAADRIAADRDLEGSFFGIGVSFQLINDTLVVVEVVSGAPAEEAGVLAGDKIVEVDGQNIAGVGITNEDVFDKLRGPENTTVQITVQRYNSASPLHFDLVRARVDSSPVDASYLINDSIGYLRLGKFSDNTYQEYLSSMANLVVDGATSLILDLRGNGGGYMLPAVLVANEFIGKRSQTIVSTRGRNPGDNRNIHSDRSGVFGQMPLVILIDEYTASASEILAGAMQDNDRAVIVGRRSFGKGLVQNPFELSDSSELRLTVQRYYTPSGRCIQKTYKPGGRYEYESEIYDRYSNGELFIADSIRIDSTQIFYTLNKRPVYGGGGITPDVFVPTDTSAVTNYYIKVANAGLLRDYAYSYADQHREQLSNADNTTEMLQKLPDDYTLLRTFVTYAASKGVAPRWYYINTSASLIVNQIKALIARDILGLSSYYEVVNQRDPAVAEAIHQIESGNTTIPVTIGDPKR